MNQLTFFTEDDIHAMFSVFDPTGKGYINPSQYRKGEGGMLMVPIHWS